MKSTRNNDEKISDFHSLLLSQNYYERLNLTPNATQKEIKAAYRKLSRSYHPDRNPAPTAGYEFDLIHDAYATLSDEAIKREYDNLLSNGLGENLPSQSEYQKADTFEYDFVRNGEIHAVAISNNYLAIPMAGKGIHLFNNRTSAYLKLFVNSNTRYPIYYDVLISETENVLYATSSRGDVEVFCLKTGTLLRIYEKVNELGSGCIVEIDRNIKLTYNSNKITEIFSDGRTGRTIKLKGINSVSVSPDKQFAIVSSGEECSVTILNLTNGKIVNTFVTGFPVYCAQMSPDGKFIICGGWGSKVNLYDVITGTYKQLSVLGELPETRDFSFSPNGKYIAIAEHGYGYSIYSIEQDKIIYRERVPGFINDIFFTTNNRLIINAVKHVYNMPIPSGITINSNYLGADISEIPAVEFPSDEESRRAASDRLSFFSESETEVAVATPTPTPTPTPKSPVPEIPKRTSQDKGKEKDTETEKEKEEELSQDKGKVKEKKESKRKEEPKKDLKKSADSISVLPTKKSENISRKRFNQIVDSYESTSWLAGFCIFSPYRSKAIRALYDLSDNKEITKEQIQDALNKDSKRRLNLFNDENKTGNKTSTDRVILDLRNEFKF